MRKPSGLKIQPSFSPTELAGVLGVSAQIVHKLTREGTITQTRKGTYGLDAVTGYCKRLRATIQGQGAGRGLTDERRALIHEKVLVARMERRRLESKLVSADWVITTWSALIGVAKTRLLGIGRRIAPHLVGCKTPVEAETLVYDAVCDALSELSKMPDVLDHGGPDVAGDIEDADEVADTSGMCVPKT